MQDTNFQHDPNDPVTQALAAMPPGSIPEQAPVHETMPAESHIQSLMQNLLHNSGQVGDSSVLMRVLAGLGDVLDAPRHAVQSLAGTDQTDMDARYNQIAQKLPAPSSTQMLQMAMSGMTGQGVIGPHDFLYQMLAGQDTGRRWSPTTVKIAGDVATDPLSYIGVGLFKGLAKAGAKAGAPVAIQKGLEAAQAGDEAAAAALGAIGDMVVKGVQMGLFKAPNRALAQMFPDLPKWTEYAHNTSAMGDALQWLDHWLDRQGSDLPTLQGALSQGTANMTGIMNQLPATLRQRVDPRQLEMALTKMPASTSARNPASWVKTTNPAQDIGTAYANYKKWLQADMGLDDPGRAATFYTHFTDWWKQQALGSLSTILNNAKSGALGSLLTSGPGGAARTVADLVDNAGNILAGRQFTVKRAEDLAKQLDVAIPSSLHETASAALASSTGSSATKNLFGSQLRDVGAGAAVGALGAYEDDQNPLAGALVGGATMAGLSKIAPRLRKSFQGVETVLREGAWHEGVSRELVNNMSTMENMLIGAMIHGRPGKTIDQRTLDDIASMVRSTNGAVNPQVALTYLNTRGVPQATQDLASHALDDLFQHYSERGVAASNRFNFDYQDLSPVERVLTQTFPFSTWYLKAVPFFTEQGFKHPVLANLVGAKAETSAQMQDERGLPTRFAGTLPDQTQSALISKLIGRPLQAFHDPLSAMFPFAGAAHDIQGAQFDDQQGGIGQMLSALAGASGLGVNPLISSAAQIAGVTPNSEMGAPSNSSFLRVGNAEGGATALASRGVEAVTGKNPGYYLNPNRGIEAIIDSIREAGDAVRHGGQGRQVTDPMELAIERRVDELALKQTGKPVGSDDAAVAPYLRAKVSKAGPIWQQAANEVHQERGTQGLLGFVSSDLRPDAILTPEEASIRDAKQGALIEPAVAHQITQAASNDPNGVADPKVVAQVKAAADAVVAQTGGQMPQSVTDHLASPTNANVAWVSGQIYDWQTEQAPLMQGYGSGGNPEQRRISNELGLMSHAGEGLSPEENQAQITANQAKAIGRIASSQNPSLRGTGPIAAAQAIPGQEKATILADDPLLAEYLKWRDVNPGKKLEDFLLEKYGK
jgi:hypothetical protein